jgi:hypothetical protein
MNKKLLLASAVVTAGFVALTAFAPKTQEEQRQEIQQSVQVKLDTYRDSLMMVCDERIAMESDRRFNEAIAARAMDNTPKGKGRTTARGPRVTPLPQGSTPTKTTTDQKRDNMEGQPKTEEKKEKMSGEPKTEEKKSKMKREGGGN